MSIASERVGKTSADRRAGHARISSGRSGSGRNGKPTASQENRAKTMESGKNSPNNRSGAQNENSAGADRTFEIQMDQLHVVEQTV